MAKLYLEHLLGDRERILLTTRQHWLVLARNIALEVTVILFVFALAITFSLMYPGYGPWIGLAGAVLVLIPLATMTRDILVWSNRQYIITNWRVIQLSGVINKSVMDSSLDKVNDVKMHQTLLGRTFDYGDVEILTGSELGVNRFGFIEDPVRFKTTMLNAKEINNRPEQAAASQSMDVPSLLARLGELRERGVISESEFQQKKTELLAKL